MRNYREISRRVFLDPEYGGVNMEPVELRLWAKDSRHKLASTPTGWASLRRLPGFIEKPAALWNADDRAFAKKVLGFNRRHAKQVLEAFREDRLGGFGAEVGQSGWSKRHIALRNWGHDPSREDSPLYAADRQWLDENPGAQRRRQSARKANPAKAAREVKSRGKRGDTRWDREPAYLTAGHHSRADTRRAAKIASTIAERGASLGKGNFGEVYWLDEPQYADFIVKVPTATNLHGRRWTEMEQRNNLLHEAGVANELTDAGFGDVVPSTVFVELADGRPALIREYGEPVDELSPMEYTTLERRLYEMERQTGWRLQDLLQVYRRRSGGVFVGDVGLWKAPVEVRVGLYEDGAQPTNVPSDSSLSTYLSVLANELLVKKPGPFRITTLPSLIHDYESAHFDLREAGSVQNALDETLFAWHIESLVNGLEDRDALGLESPEDVRDFARKYGRHAHRRENPSLCPPDPRGFKAYYTPDGSPPIEDVIACWVENDAAIYDDAMPLLYRTRDLAPYREYRAEELRRGHGSPEYRQLVSQIRRNGITEPLIVHVDKSGQAWVGEGNHRHQIATELGIEYLPVRFLFVEAVSKATDPPAYYGGFGGSRSGVDELLAMLDEIDRKENPEPPMQYLIETADIHWSGDAARVRLEHYADRPGVSAQAVYELAFAMHPPKRASSAAKRDIDNYKLPVMDVIDGMLTLVPRAVSTATAYLHGARGIQIHANASQKQAAEKRLRRFKKEIQRCRDREEVLDGYRSRPGLEGPFRFRSGKILYYDPREGAYYDPGSDVYVSDEDMMYHHGMLREKTACPLAATDLEVNTRNRNRAIRADYIQYGPLNVDEPGDYWIRLAEHWNTTVRAAKKSLCANCVAFDISPRMRGCMPGETSDDEGVLGYCWMHDFKCHSARTCYTWAKGGPIEEDDVSMDWQSRKG